jgi:hypothetical protein
LDENLPKGSLVLNDEMSLQKLKLFSEETVLEQGAQSSFRAHFILDKGPVYLFRWRLESSTFRDVLFLNKYVGGWTKEIIWDSKTSQGNLEEIAG